MIPISLKSSEIAFLCFSWAVTCSFAASPGPKTTCLAAIIPISNRAVQTFGFFDPLLSNKKSLGRLGMLGGCLSLLLVAMEVAFGLDPTNKNELQNTWQLTWPAFLHTHGEVLQHLCCPRDFIWTRFIHTMEACSMMQHPMWF